MNTTDSEIGRRERSRRGPNKGSIRSRWPAALVLALGILVPGAVAHMQTASPVCAPTTNPDCRLTPAQSGTGAMAFAEEIHTWDVDVPAPAAVTLCLWHSDRAVGEAPISFRALVYAAGEPVGEVIAESITPATLLLDVVEGPFVVHVDNPLRNAVGRHYGIHAAVDAAPDLCAKMLTPPTDTPTPTRLTDTPTPTPSPTATPTATPTPRPTGLELLPHWRVLEAQDGHGTKDVVSAGHGSQPWSFAFGSGRGWRGGRVLGADGKAIDITSYRTAVIRAQAAQDGVFYLELKLGDAPLHAGDKVRVPLTRGTQTTLEVSLVPTSLRQLDYLAISDPTAPFELLAVTLIR